MKQILIIILMLSLHRSYAVLYKINGTEFNRMPQQFRLDNYDKCLNDQNGIYCAVEFVLVSDTPSELLTMIQEYSEHVIQHFNHTKPLYGVCVTQSCQQFVQNETVELKKVLEGCLNESIWREYSLKTKVNDNFKCTKSNEIMDINSADIFVLAFIIMLVTMNITASLYDLLYIMGTDRNANKYLIIFSIPRNCKKLVNVQGRADPRQNCLRCLDSTKTILISLVIFGHSIFPFIVFCQNIHYLETAQEHIFWKIISNGFLIVQLFFLISGLLLAYNLQMSSEKNALDWVEVPKRIAIRWLRLTPPYAVVLAITATWLRHAGSGPFWKTIVNEEVSNCSRVWWSHLIYINNYYDSLCMPHTWYVAADFQLHIVGLLVCVLCKGVVRKIILVCLFVIGIITSAVLTYIHDLNGSLLMIFEYIRSLFAKDPTFIHTYKPAYTNLCSFIIGISLGLIIYQLQNNRFDIKKYKKYQALYYSLMSGMALTILLGSMVYRDSPRAPIYVRVIFAALLKPMYSAIAALIIFGMVFKFEKPMRQFFEARVWIVLCRISYCAYICHELFFRTMSGSNLMMRSDIIHLFNITLGNISISFFFAIILWLLVESPFLTLIDTIRRREKNSQKVSHTGAENGIKIIDVNTSN